VVLHAGAQDMAILKRAWGVQPRNVFDTQIAAGFAGFGAQTGYGNLLGRVMGAQLSKSAGFTRWDVRPLTREQLDYARSDVEGLLSDVALVEVARRQPRSTEQLQAIRGVRPDLGRRRGAAVLEAIRQGLEAEPPPAERFSRGEPDPGDAARIGLCEALVRHRV